MEELPVASAEVGDVVLAGSGGADIHDCAITADARAADGDQFGGDVVQRDTVDVEHGAVVDGDWAAGRCSGKTWTFPAVTVKPLWISVVPV